MSHVKLIAETRVYIQKHEIYGYFLPFFKSFRGKMIKKYSKGNEEWIESETATITSNYVLHNHLSISQAHLQTKQTSVTQKKEIFL